MAYADGTVVVDTELDTEGFAAGSDRMKSATKSLESTVKKLGSTLRRAVRGESFDDFRRQADDARNAISQMEKELETLGRKKVETDDFRQLNTEIKNTEAALLKLYEKRDIEKSLGTKESSRGFRRLEMEIQNVEDKLLRLESMRQQLVDGGLAYKSGTETSEYAELQQRIEDARASLEAMHAEASRVEAETAQTAADEARAADEAARHAAEEESAALRANALRTALGTVGTVIRGIARTAGGTLVNSLRTALSITNRLAFGNRNYARSFSGLISSAKKFTLSLLGARGVYALLRKAVSAYMDANSQLSSQLSGVWTGLGNLLGPIISRIISLVSTAVAYITALFKLIGISGKAAATSIGKAAGSASGAAKELKRQLASFDDLNILSSNDSGGGGGGGGGGASADASLADVELPDWVKLIVEKLKAGQWSEAALVLTDKLNGMIKDVDWAGIGDKIGYYLNGALEFLATAIMTFNWLGLGASLAECVNHILENVDWANLGYVLAGRFRIVLLTAAGFLQNLDWSAFAKAFSAVAKGFFNGIYAALSAVDWREIGTGIGIWLRSVDWAGIAKAVAQAIGAAFGGIASLIGSLIGEAFGDVGDFFDGWIEDAKAHGGSLVEGLLMGIGAAIYNIGAWIYDNIFKPFIDAFCEAFGIHSPSTVMEEKGGFIGEGLLLGIANVFANIGTWIEEYILEPIRKALEDGPELIIKAKAKLTTWIDSLKKKTIEFKAKLTKWTDSLKKKVVDFEAKLTTWKESLKNKIVSFKAKLTTWQEALSNKIVSFKAKLTSWTDSLSSKILSFKAKLTTWQDSLGGKILAFKAKLTTWQDALANKVVSFRAKLTSWTDALKNKTISFTAKLTSWIDGLKNKVVGGFTGKKAGGGAYYGGSWHNFASGGYLRGGVARFWNCLPKYASGTRNAHGSMFVAGEAGPEIVGHVGGRTEVLNRSQLAATMEAAVKSAMVAVVNSVGAAILSRMAECSNAVVNAVLYTANTPIEIQPIADLAAGTSDIVAKLQAIASRVTYSAPAVSGNVVPYSVASGGSDSSGIANAFEASNDELASVIIQAVGNATTAIVSAVQRYSGTTVNIDENYITDMTIKEINRRARATGQSPLLDT